MTTELLNDTFILLFVGFQNDNWIMAHVCYAHVCLDKILRCSCLTASFL